MRRRKNAVMDRSDPNFYVSGGTVTWGCLAYPCRPGVSRIFLNGLLDKCGISSYVSAAVWLAIRLLWLLYDMRSGCNISCCCGCRIHE
jgi:hypothetical protein